MFNTMKNLSLFCIVLVSIFLACCSGSSENDSNKKMLKDFAIRFGEMASNNDLVGLQKVYPEAEGISNLSFYYNPDQIEIFPEGNDTYKIKYDNGVSLIVRAGYDGAMEVVSSTGL